MVPSAESQELTKVLLLMLWVGQNIALHALPAVRNSALLTAAFQSHLTLFFDPTFFQHKTKVMWVTNSRWDLLATWRILFHLHMTFTLAWGLHFNHLLLYDCLCTSSPNRPSSAHHVDNRGHGVLALLVLNLLQICQQSCVQIWLWHRVSLRVQLQSFERKHKSQGFL